MPLCRSTFACALLGVFACAADPVESSAGSGDAGAGSSSGDIASTGGTTTTQPSTTAEGSTGTESSVSSTQPTSDATDATQGSTGSTSESDGGSGESVGAESSSGVGVPEEHHVQHGDQAACDEPLWCFFNGMIEVPAGGPIEGQECFVAPVDPPYEVSAMHYSVASLHTELETFELRVYAWDGGDPTEQLAAVELNSLAASPMEHEHVFEPAIQVDTAGFRVGFAATEPGLASAIGMAVDTTSTIEDVSFIRTEGACDAPTWQEVIGAGVEPTGNWCIDATVRTIP